jgi:predicted transcriptional regulator
MHFDHRKLKSHRRRLGLSLGKAAALTEIPKSSIDEYERGLTTPPLHRFMKLCRVYGCDILEIVEMLGSFPVPPGDLRRFRIACRKENTTPEEALRDFMLVYADDE